MTAEAAVMNRLGVALAADSAVTASTSPGEAKIYTSSEKLFQLSMDAPIGLLVYGNADFTGMPWETVIKQFRRELGTKRLETAEEYAGSFFRFLGSSKEMIPARTQRTHASLLVQRLYLHLRDQLQDAFNRAAEKRDGLADEELAPIIESEVENRLKEIRVRDILQTLGSKAKSRVRATMSNSIRDIRNSVFGKLPLTAKAKRDLTSIAVDALTRQYFGPRRAGIVVAGFGEAEYMPCLFHYLVEEMVLGRPRYFLQTQNHVSHENDAAIHAFAQQETVVTFLEGIDPSLEQYMRVSTSTVVQGAVAEIIKAIEKADADLGKALGRQLNRETTKLVDALFTAWQSQRRQHWGPVVEIVAALPKDELAAMAEALVNLTKFRRRVTPTRETVGGPIDVAVITKGDGFVWVKRKHYFNPDLNPRVIGRYQRGA